MLYGDVITLIADKTERDEDGYIVSTETKREIYADVKSATRTEFYDAIRSGIQISRVFNVYSHDYNNERIVEYSGRRYDVVRTYQTDLDHIQLNCSEVKRQ